MKSGGEGASVTNLGTEAIQGVSSVSSITANAKGQPLKGLAGKEAAPAKPKCQLKKPRKQLELYPKEAMLAYRLNLRKKLQEAAVEEMKAKELENTNLKEQIVKLQKEQEEIIKTVMAMKEDERNMLSTEPVYTKDQVTSLRKKNWSKQTQHTEILQKVVESIAKTDRDIETRKQGIEEWIDYRDKGHLQHKQEIELLQAEMKKMEMYFEQMTAQLEQDRSRSLEESERVTEETIEQNQCIATEKAIARMDRYDRKEVMENYWLREEIKIQQEDIEKLFHQTEELTEENLTLINDANQRHLEELNISRNTEQFSSVENLCENSTMEIDIMRRSPKQSVVFDDENRGLSTATTPPQSAEVTLSKEEGKNVEADGGGMAEAGDKKDDENSKQGPWELKIRNGSGRPSLNSQHMKAPFSEEVKPLDSNSDQWPVTRSMLHEFCKNSKRY